MDNTEKVYNIFNAYIRVTVKAINGNRITIGSELVSQNDQVLYIFEDKIIDLDQSLSYPFKLETIS